MNPIKGIPFVQNHTLDAKYFLWFLLILFRPLFGEGTVAYDYVLAGSFLLFTFLNIHKPKELLYLFILAYMSNIYSWLSHFSLIGSSGARILLLDVYFILLYLLSAILIIHSSTLKIRRFYLLILFVILSAIWITNYVTGFLAGPPGSVIGEGRFYVASGLFLLIITFFYQAPEFNLRKVLNIVSLSSLAICFHVILIAVGLSTSVDDGGDGSGRFNPGAGACGIIVLGLIISCVDFSFRKQYHILRVNKITLIGFYTMIIFISGVRSMAVVAILVLGYFLLLSRQLSLTKKF